MRKPELTIEQIEHLKRREGEAWREVIARKQTATRLEALELQPSKRSPGGVLAGLAVRASARGLREAELALKTLQKFQRCGAATRRGTPCQCKPEPGMERCKLHGGRSTGPRTEAGREAIRESNRRRAQKRRSAGT